MLNNVTEKREEKEMIMMIMMMKMMMMMGMNIRLGPWLVSRFFSSGRQSSDLLEIGLHFTLSLALTYD